MTTSHGLPSDRHERLMAMRAERRYLDDTDVEAAIEEVDNSELVSLLEEFAHLPRGRHRTLHLRSLLIGLYLCTQDTGGKIVLERITDILYFRISPRLRELLDIPEYADTDQGFEAAYAVVRRLFHAMKDAMNPSPLPPNGHLSRSEAHDLIAAADIDDLAERERRLALFTEFVLDASVRPLHSCCRSWRKSPWAWTPRPSEHSPAAAAQTGQSSQQTRTPAGTYGKATTGTPTRRSPTPCAHRPRPPRRAQAQDLPGHEEDVTQEEVPLRLRRPPHRDPRRGTRSRTPRGWHPQPRSPPGPRPRRLPRQARSPPRVQRPEDPSTDSGSVDTNPASSPVTAPTTTPSPTSGSSPSGPWATSPSTTTARTSSASRPERTAQSSSRAAGAAPLCRIPSSTPPSICTPPASTGRRGSN